LIVDKIGKPLTVTIHPVKKEQAAPNGQGFSMNVGW
jgi:hypothetical protein